MIPVAARAGTSTKKIAAALTPMAMTQSKSFATKKSPLGGITSTTFSPKASMENRPKSTKRLTQTSTRESNKKKQVNLHQDDAVFANAFSTTSYL